MSAVFDQRRKMTNLMMHWQLIQGADESDPSKHSGNRRIPSSWTALHAGKFTELQDEKRKNSLTLSDVLDNGRNEGEIRS